jgi:DNA-binding response OmpR family regulator
MHGTADAERSDQFRFTQRATLAQGLEALDQSEFHLVLLDLSLPNTLASDSVAKTLKKAEHLPVIALVDEGDTSKVSEALRLGVDDYVVKGHHRDSLISSMRHVIERKKLIAGTEPTGRRATGIQTGLSAHLSHEIRNALACIHQFGTILIDGVAGSVSTEQREYLCIIIENATKIRQVMDNALKGPAV